MSAVHRVRRGLLFAATAGLLATAACSPAVTAPPGTAAPGTARASTPSSSGTGGTNRAGDDAAVTPGWRVVKTFGPAGDSVSGLLTVDSAADAWSVWAGPGLARVERWTGSTWARVPVPPTLTAYVRATVSVGASSPGNAWLFGTYRSTEALRWTGAGWLLQPIPPWVVRRDHSGRATVASAVFGPGDVWVFSLGAGAYAAHYDGRAWAKVTLPAVPAGVSAVAPDDIWALGTGMVLHWNGRRWASIGVPAIPLPSGASLRYSGLTAAGPNDAWLVRTISYPSALPVSSLMHWNGRSWLTVTCPTNEMGSIAPDGSGGLWAEGINVTPAGFWLLYHLTGGHWTGPRTVPGTDTHSEISLAHIPGTRSMWATGSAFGPRGSSGVILRYGP